MRYENTAELAEHAAYRAIVNVDIRSIEVAEGFLNPVPPRFENRVWSPLLPNPIQTDRQTELKRHIESWRRRRSSIELDAGKMVHGIPAILNQI